MFLLCSFRFDNSNKGYFKSKSEFYTAPTATHNGPGCNHLKYDFMDKILKIHDFFGLNLQSIFSYHEKKFFFENSAQNPLWAFGGPKTAKNRKKHVF